MKIGLNTLVLRSPFGDDCLDLIPKVKKLGFDIFEICVEELGFDIGKVAECCKEYELDLLLTGAFGETRDVSSEDAAIRENGKNYILECVKMAAGYGGRLFCGPVYSAVGKARRLPDDARRAEWERSVKSLREIAPVCDSLGVRIGIEPLNRFETDMVNTTQQGLRMIEEIGAGCYGILLDMFHANIEDKSIPQSVRDCGPRLLHVHTCENDRGAPGSGHQDWPGVTAALREIGYSGALVIESFTPDCVEIAKAASIWRPLADSQEALAADGLRFLREISARA